MSQTSAAGSGGSAAPGWYTDPHDPNGLRWWSGEGWTEHVSGGSGAAAGAGAGAADGVDSQAPLPSRRALRDPATEASEAAEAALRAQAAQQPAAQEQAQQQAQAAQAAQQAQAAQAAQQAQAAQAAQLAQAAQQQAAQEQAQQLAAQQAAQQAALAAQQQATAAPAGPPLQPPTPPPVQQQSPPVPTLPVAPTSFLEQQGYAPVGSTPASAAADPNAWNQPAEAPEPQATQPPPTQPPAAPAQPVQPTQPNAWNQPLQPTQPAAPAQPAASAQPNAWNQPAQPTQAGWGAPTEPSDDLDSLFAAPTPEAGNPDSQPGQWGLSPTSSDDAPGRNPDAAVSGSSTFWGWLIAISPILAAGAVIYVLLSTKSTLTDWPFLAAVAAPYLLVVLFAVADRAVLIQLGHSQPRSPAWALLSAPIYLIARAGETRAEDGSGTALTLAWFVSVLIAIGGIVGYGFLTGHALIAGLPT